jgi:hypothetical protein
MKKALILVAVVAAAFAAFVAFKMLQPVPDDLNLATTRLTDNGHFTVSIEPEDPGFRRNTLHSWIATVKDADGGVFENARIGIDGGMPQHGHGLPTAPQMTEYLGDGKYRIEGVRFNMRGWWEFRLAISRGKLVDTITFNMVY